MIDIGATRLVAEPPDWAVRQRDLFDLMAAAVDEFVEGHLDGKFPDYPERVLAANRNHVQECLDRMRAEGHRPGDPNEDYLATATRSSSAAC